VQLVAAPHRRRHERNVVEDLLRDRTAIADAPRTGDRGRDLYHSAFEAVTADGRFVIEMTPIPDSNGDERVVVAEGAVGSRWTRRFRVFRSEIRRWRDGTISDRSSAIVSDDAEHALRGHRS
jgi:hypothetical protein